MDQICRLNEKFDFNLSVCQYEITLVKLVDLLKFLVEFSELQKYRVVPKLSLQHHLSDLLSRVVHSMLNAHLRIVHIRQFLTEIELFASKQLHLPLKKDTLFTGRLYGYHFYLPKLRLSWKTVLMSSKSDAQFHALGPFDHNHFLDSFVERVEEGVDSIHYFIIWHEVWAIFYGRGL